MEEKSKTEVFSLTKARKDRISMIKKRVEKERSSLPVYTEEEIKSYRLPYHEAVMMKLRNTGFYNSVEFLRELIEYQERYRYEAGEESLIWTWPVLTESFDIFDKLKEVFKKAERAHSENKIDIEVDELLGLALGFCFGCEQWWWLGHRIILAALQASYDYKKDRGKKKCQIEYFLGKFLFLNAHELELAYYYLMRAKSNRFAVGWTIDVPSEERGASLFLELSKLITQLNLVRVADMMNTEPYKATTICNETKKIALEACFYDGVVQALIAKGKCQMEMSEMDQAMVSFQTAHHILKLHPNVKLKFELLMHCIFTYLRNDDMKDALCSILEMKNYARLHNDFIHLAQAYKYLGEYYVRLGDSSKGTPFLMEALFLFKKLDCTEYIWQTRILAAIALGDDLMPTFFNIVRNADPAVSENYRQNLQGLIQWKEVRHLPTEIIDLPQTSNISLNTLYATSNRESEVDLAGKLFNAISIIENEDYDSEVKLIFSRNMKSNDKDEK